MSVSKYRYTPSCDGQPCPGDCDLCGKEDDMDDLISRQAAIDVTDSETVSTNPEHFKSSEKFIKFMDDDDIASFGKWQWANGFNTALVATKVRLEKLPSAQPDTDEWCHDCKEYDQEKHCCPRWNRVIRETLKDARSEATLESAIDYLQSIGWMQEHDRILSSTRAEWIPCSERLPEENTSVLLGVRFKDDFKYFVTMRTDYNYWTGLGRDIRGELAWMPLPEPYREEE